MRATFESPFALGDRVWIDGCRDLTAIVTGLCWRNERVSVECSWIAVSDAKEAWIQAWRLTLAEPKS